MLDIQDFWKRRLAGAKQSPASKRSGWLAEVQSTPGFVEPDLSVVDGNPETARLLIIAAPGAVGKSSYATALAAATASVVVNLAQTDPLGGNFFSGGLSRAFGLDAPSAAARGEVGLIVDALDEAQMRAGPEGFKAGLLVFAEITKAPAALPTVLLGRGLAAEEAYLLLTANGYEACLLRVEYFTDEQAAQYLRNKLPVIADRSPKVASAFQTHEARFRDLAEQARAKLIAVSGCDETKFVGYAPVLDAICEFTLEADGGLNPQAKIAKLKAANQIELIDDITISILEREHGKVRDQFRNRHPEATPDTLQKIYTVEDQLQQVASALFGTAEPPLPDLPKENYYTTYQEMVEQFAPQHPFVSGNGVASNPVFAAYVVAWALKKSGQANLVRKAALAKPGLMSGITFELYQRRMQSETHPIMPLEDVGILYQALNSQVVPGQRVQLEISGEEEIDGSIEITFEILERIDPNTDRAPSGHEWGPFRTTASTVLEMHSPFSNVYVNADITVELGDGIIQQIGAPTELSVEAIMISAKQILVHGGSPDSPKELQTVRLSAREASCEGVQVLPPRDGVALSVSWPGAKTYPWNAYAVDVVPPADPGVEFMRRRLRKVLTAFRSHSKGALVRLAAKIDHSRMTKDDRGVELVRRLVADQILELFDARKFYRLDSDAMGKKLGVSYHDLALSRFTPACDSYLYDVLAGMRGRH